LNLRSISGPEDWCPHLAGVDAVVNCAGVLQDSIRDSTSAVHEKAPAALWEACAQAGVLRVVQISAVGVDRGAVTAFSLSKFAGDRALEASNLDWVILRPSVVVGRSAYGGSALFRGLAALPLTLEVENAGPLDIVQLDDVAETVARLIEPGAPARVDMELCGPERLRFEEVVARYRAWLGWRPARPLKLPRSIMSLGWRLGDAVSWFGWRPPVRSTAQRELLRGAIGDATAWRAATGIEPQGLTAALAASPASVQERWFARLYLLKPLLFAIFILFWILTAFVALGPGWNLAVGVMRASPAAPVSELVVIAGAFADMAVAVMLLFRRTAKLGLLTGLFLSVAYLAAGTVLRPDLWADPLGPMLKVWPIIAFNFVLLAVLEER
jgi:uncharacterized protein YbjT (DUF2867 family)